MTGPRVPSSTMLRGAAAAVAAVAALGPSAHGRGGPTLRVLLADVSASVAGGTPTGGDLAALRAGLSRGDRVAVVAFADGAATVAGPEAPPEFDAARAQASLAAGRPAGVGRWATSLAAGLDAARRVRRGDERLEILLATDGRVTDAPASLDAAVRALRSAGGADLRVLPRAGTSPPAALASLRGPGRAVVGEAVTLEASGVAGPDGATVELLGGGAVIETRRVEGAGAFRIAFSRLADAPGLATWEARTRESPDAPRPAARVVVARPGAALLVADGASRPELAAALGVAATEIDVAQASDPDLAAAAEGHDAVVVDDVEAAPDRLRQALLPFARGGGGVLLLGGPRRGVVAAGDVAGGISPLRATPPDAGDAVVYLAIDGSGSMAEPWPAPGGRGGADDVPRDVVVRAAAETLVGRFAARTRLVLRRFRDRPVPDGPPAVIDLAAPGAPAAATDAVRRLPAPGGSTAFLPVLAEAFDVLGGRAERVRVALLLTDGRSVEDAAAVRAAVRRLLDAGVRVAVVVPGPLAADAADASLLRALDGTTATVRAAASVGDLGPALADAERTARAGEPFVDDRALEAVAGAAPALAASDLPPRASKLDRTWAAPDATVLARTTDGVPVAAVRREGAGLVGAIAARVPDPAWLDGDGGSALVRALLAAVRRRGAAAARTEIDGGTLVARIDLAEGAEPPVRAEFRVAGTGGPRVESAALRSGPRGALAADLPGFAADRVAFVTRAGAEVAAAGLDRPGAAEAAEPPAADLDALAVRLRGGAPQRGVPLRPVLAALSLVLIVLGSVKSRARPTR